MVTGVPRNIIAKPVSGSPTAAMSGTTRIAVGPFSVARLFGTIDFWYAGSVNSALTPPPPPKMKWPGGGWLRLDGVVAKFTESRSSPHEVSNRYPFEDVTARSVPPTLVTNGSEAGKSGSGCGAPATVLSPASPLEK